MNTFICINCNKEFEAYQETRLFCSRSCQISYRNKQNKGKIKRSQHAIDKQKESNRKFWISKEGIEEKERRSKRAIIQSNKPFYRAIFVKAIDKFRNDPEKLAKSIKKQSDTIKQKVLDGTHNTWKTRNIRSYPELYVENYLLLHNIHFEKEKYIHKSTLKSNETSGFLLDFFFPDKKINLEIDGAQHLKTERIEHDIYRDKLLSDNGYIVIRIPWVNIKNPEKKKWFLNELDKVIQKLE
jgi:very-short-patch-repair endonuclease